MNAIRYNPDETGLGWKWNVIQQFNIPVGTIDAQRPQSALMHERRLIIAR